MSNSNRVTTHQLATAAILAALYAVMSYFAAIFGVAFGPIQCRFAEALCVLPFLMPGASWGLFVGCLIANLLSPYGALDVVFGSLATLVAALITSRMPNKYLAALPPVLVNATVIGTLITYYEVGFGSAFFGVFIYNAANIALGQAIVCYALGLPLLNILSKIPSLRPYFKR